MTPGPTKKRLSDSFNTNNNNNPANSSKISLKNNQSSVSGLEEAKERDPAADLRNFGSRGGVQNDHGGKPSKPKVNNMRNSLLCQAKEDKQGAQVFFGNNLKQT